MTEPTKEQVWKEEARKAYQDQQYQDNEGGCREPIGFVQGYIAAKKSDCETIELLKKDLVYYKSRGLVFHDRDKLNEQIKTLKEHLAEAVKLAKLGVYSVNGLLTHNHESWEMSAESWLFKTKIFLEKLDKENKDEK